MATVDLAVANDHELDIKSTMMYRHEDYVGAIELVEAGKVQLKPLISKIPFAQYLDAYKYIDANRETTMKVIMPCRKNKRKKNRETTRCASRSILCRGFYSAFKPLCGIFELFDDVDVLRAVRFAGTAMETFACLAAFACCGFVAAAIDHYPRSRTASGDLRRGKCPGCGSAWDSRLRSTGSRYME